jgi:hypothetical protein
MILAVAASDAKERGRRTDEAATWIGAHLVAR